MLACGVSLLPRLHQRISVHAMVLQRHIADRNSSMNRTEEAYSPQRRVQIARTGPGSADSGSIRTSLSSGSHSSVSASLSAQIDLRVQSETWYSCESRGQTLRLARANEHSAARPYQRFGALKELSDKHRCQEKRILPGRGALVLLWMDFIAEWLAVEEISAQTVLSTRDIVASRRCRYDSSYTGMRLVQRGAPCLDVREMDRR